MEHWSVPCPSQTLGVAIHACGGEVTGHWGVRRKHTPLNHLCGLRLPLQCSYMFRSNSSSRCGCDRCNQWLVPLYPHTVEELSSTPVCSGSHCGNHTIVPVPRSSHIRSRKACKTNSSQAAEAGLGAGPCGRPCWGVGQVLVIQRLRTVEVSQDNHMDRIVVVTIVLQNQERVIQAV